MNEGDKGIAISAPFESTPLDLFRKFVQITGLSEVNNGTSGPVTPMKYENVSRHVSTMGVIVLGSRVRFSNLKLRNRLIA